jgi:hypothetical protein
MFLSQGIRSLHFFIGSFVLTNRSFPKVVIWIESFPYNSYLEVLITIVAVFRDRVFKEEVRLNEVLKIGPNSIGLVSF